jgi:hypothetical protein
MSRHPLYNETGLQKNNKPQVLYALTNKQTELKELQREFEIKIAQIKLDLTALELTICLFDEEYIKTPQTLYETLSERKNRANTYFVKGEARRLVLEVLRKSSNPLKTREVSKIIQEKKEFDYNDTVVNAEVTKIVTDALRYGVKTGIIEKIESVNDTLFWKIKE